MVIHESAEDYLESILVLQEQCGQVRSIDIVNKLGYSKPSVSIAMKKLRENGYISMGRRRHHHPERHGYGDRQPGIWPPQGPDKAVSADGRLAGAGRGGRVQGGA